jgi:hypothetical protein
LEVFLGDGRGEKIGRRRRGARLKSRNSSIEYFGITPCSDQLNKGAYFGSKASSESLGFLEGRISTNECLNDPS